MKPCKWCGKDNHQSYQCIKSPKNIAAVERLKEYKKLRPCKFCLKENPNHFSYSCPKRPTNEKLGISPDYKRKVSPSKWFRTRREWKKANPPDFQGYWYCKIVPCLLPGVPLDDSTLTLDHVIPRSKRPDLTFDITNLVEAHGICNGNKGSKVDGDFEHYEARVLE